jgi:DHA2 family multidrug resistance protein
VQHFLESQSSRFESLITGDANRAALKLLADTVRREALVLTYNDALMMIGVVFIFALCLMPLVKSPRATPLTSDRH